MYIEYTSSDFVLPVLNRGCFIQYYTTSVDKPPNEWVTEMMREEERGRRDGGRNRGREERERWRDSVVWLT